MCAIRWKWLKIADLDEVILAQGLVFSFVGVETESCEHIPLRETDLFQVDELSGHRCVNQNVSLLPYSVKNVAAKWIGLYWLED